MVFPRTTFIFTSVAIFLLPGIEIFSWFPEFRPEYLVQFVLMLCSLPHILNISINGRYKFFVSVLFLFMIGSSALSIASTEAVFANRVVVNDFMIMLSMATFFLTMYIASRAVEADAGFFIRSLFVIAICAATFGLFQKYNLLSVNHWATPFYTDSAGMQAAHSLTAVIEGASWARIGGTHGDPRHYGYLLVVLMSVPCAVLLAVRNWLSRAVALFTVLLCGLALIYTQSRTPILAALLGASVMSAVYLVTIRRTGLLIFIIVVVGALAAFALTFGPLRDSYLGSRLLNTQSDYFVQSFGPRITDLVTPFQEASRQPLMWLFGMGPSKSVLLGSAHSEIGFVFRRYGLPGLLFIFSLLAAMAYFALKTFVSRTDRAGRVISLAALMASVNWAVTMLSESIIHDPQRMGANMIFLGAILALVQRQRSGPSAREADGIPRGSGEN